MPHVYFLVVLYIVTPVFIIYLTEKNSIANRIGTVIMAYIIGLILGHIGFIPTGSSFFHELNHANEKLTLQQLFYLQNQGLITSKDVLLFNIRNVQNWFLNITIPLAIPLLLFSVKIKEWFRMAGKTMISLLLGLAGVLFVVIIGFFIFKSNISGLWKVAGMLIGLYTGGTPNLAALKIMLDVNAETYILTHTYDTIIGVVYLFFLMSVGKGIFRKFLNPYPRKDGYFEKVVVNANGVYQGIFAKKKIFPLIIALLAAISIFIVAVLISLLVKENQVMIIIILTITTLSILGSLIPYLNKADKTFELGMYFILVFSMVVASMANIKLLLHLSSSLFFYITIAVFGSLFIHVLLSKLFKIDADTVMVTSTAMICSPPFVPVVAGALNNKEVIVSGLTVGIMGYAIGNYLGVIIAYFLQGF